MSAKGVSAAAILLAALVSPALLAAEAKGTGASERSFFGVSAGIKGGAGGNLVTDPTDAPDWALVLEDGAGGFGAGGGVFGEFRVLWGYLGLEVDILFDYSRNYSEIEFNDVVDTRWSFSQTAVRIPVLVKGGFDTEVVRVQLGLGPEFVLGTAAATDLEVTGYGACGDVPSCRRDVDAAVAAQRSLFDAKKQNDVYLAVGLSLAFKVAMLAITLDLRYAYDLTQPRGYDDRITYEQVDQAAGTLSYETVASNTMDLRLLIGLSYEYGFDY